MTFTASLTEIVERNDNGLLSSHASWSRCRLSDMATVLNGFAFPSARFSRARGAPLLRIRDVLKDSTEALYDGEYDPLYLVETGDLVIGMDGDFNASLWRGPPAVLNQRVCKVTPDERFYDLRLLSHVLPGYLRAINAETSSITVKHLSSRTVEDIPLPLPPLPEQRRIAAEIEKHFTRLDAAVAALERSRANLKRYRASVLKAACEGRLVPIEAELARAEGRDYEPADVLLDRILTERHERWEADQLARMQTSGEPPKDDRWKAKYKDPAPPDASSLPQLSEGWVWASTSQVSEIQGGIQKQPKRAPKQNHYPFLRVANVLRGRLDLREMHRIELFGGELDKLRLRGGDLLVVEGNGSPREIGRMAIWRDAIVDCVHQNHIIRVRPGRCVAPQYIESYWNSPGGSASVMSEASSTSGLYTLSVAKVGSIPLPLAPSAEQERIVAEVERRLSVVDELQMVIERGLKRAERLRQSILKRAFEGKLAAQDPNDEPVSVLLERIRAERVVNAAKSSSRGRRSPRGTSRTAAGWGRR